MTISSKTTVCSQSQLQAYGWQTFCIEFLCGLVLIFWYLLAIVERATLRGLGRLEKLAAPPPHDVSDECVSDVLPGGSSQGLRNAVYPQCSSNLRGL
jgi:hypothetical protein